MLGGLFGGDEFGVGETFTTSVFGPETVVTIMVNDKHIKKTHMPRLIEGLTFESHNRSKRNLDCETAKDSWPCQHGCTDQRTM